MKPNIKNKKFDCVKMKNDIQKKIYEKIKNMSVEEMLDFFNSQTNSVKVGM